MRRLDYALLRTGLFGALSQEAFEAMAEQLAITPVDAGGWVVREGEPADAAYVVVSGRLEVVVHSDEAEVRLAELKVRDHFGEQAWLQDGAPRSAGVRAVEASEVIRVGYVHLETALAQAPEMTESLRALGHRQREEALSHRTDLVRRLLASVDIRPLERVLRDGQQLYRAGEAADRVYVILSGAVELFEDREGAQVLAARVGPGLCVGERDAQHRTQSAVTVGPTRLLEVSKDRLSDVTRGSQEARDHLAVLERAWELPQRGLVTQHLGTMDGHRCLTQIFHLNDGSSFVASHLLGAETVRLRAAVGQPVRFVETPDADVRVGVEGDGRIVSVEAATGAAVLPALFSRAMERQPLTAMETAELARSGQLASAPDGFACGCMRVSWDRVRGAIDSGCGTLASLQQRTGASTACGACAPALIDALGEAGFRRVRVTKRERIGADIVRVFLAPCDDVPMRPGRPGQHVVLRAEVGGEVLERPYTLSGAAGAAHEVTARREGRFSGWLFEVEPGQVLEASSPQGAWVWDGGPSPVICLMSGIGVTPGLCFARTLIRNGWPHALVLDWSTRHKADLPLISELAAARAPNLILQARLTGRDGRIGLSALRQYATRFPSARYFVCGSASYMDAMERGLTEIGVARDRVSRETFESGGA